LIKNKKRLIISDISAPSKTINEKSSPIDVLQTAYSIMQRNNSFSNTDNRLVKKQTLITLDSKNIFLLDFRKKNFQELINLGYSKTISLKY